MATNNLTDWRGQPARDISYWHRLCAAGAVRGEPLGGRRGRVLLSLDTDSGRIEWGCDAPAGLPEQMRERFPRYVAAAANNMVMTHGGSQLRVWAGEAEFASVKAELEGRYRQIFDIFTKWHPGREDYVVRGYAHEPPAPHGADGGTPRRPRPDGWYAGIDIGNTRTKVALLRGEELVRTYQMPSEIKTSISIGPVAYFDRAAEALREIAAPHVGEGRGLTAVGVAWFGDVLKGVPLTQAADLAPWAEGSWCEEIREVPHRLAAKLGCPVSFNGDTESLALYLGASRRLPQTYLLVLGTSTGGAYFFPDGSYRGGVNLTSRIIVDLDEDAPRHTSTGAPGAFQQYSASYGIARAIGLCSRAAGRAVTRPEPDGAYLSSLLASQHDADVEFGMTCVDVLASWLVPAVADLLCHYEFGRIVLSGGNVRPPLGPALADSFKRQWREDNSRGLSVSLLSEDTGWPPSHEVAIAAANIAALRFGGSG